MAAASFFKHLARPRAYICNECIRHGAVPRQTKRHISDGWLRKTGEAEIAWKEQGQIIRAGEKQSMMSLLEERGFIKDVAG
jgi:tyrosyl-tRNA synthetase